MNPKSRRRLPKSTIRSIHKKGISQMYRIWWPDAIKFYETLKEVKGINKTQKARTHARDLYLLCRDDLDGDEERLRLVLAWYDKKLRSGDCSAFLLCPTTSWFRTKFLQIEEEMQRSIDVRLVVAYQKAVAEFQASLVLTKHEGKVNIDQLTHWLAAVNGFANELGETIEKDHIESHQHVNYWCVRTARLVAEYITWVQDQLDSWNEWSGDMREFYPARKHYLRWIQSVYREYSGKQLPARLVRCMETAGKKVSTLA